MDYVLEKKIQFSHKTDSTLYSWCIDELSDKDNDHKRGLIPYRFSCFFQVSSLRVVRRVGCRQKYSDNEISTESDNSVIIQADLQPSSRTKFDFYETSYSMLGTDRRIDSMSLSIEKLDGDSGVESCILWGSPSYSGEVDFREFTEPDHISVSVFIRREEFESLVEMVESKSISLAQLVLGQVDGFYAPWSPSISTSSIKVLTEYQKVEGEIDLNMPIPVLGKVGEFSLRLSSDSLDLNKKTGINDEKDKDHEVQPTQISLRGDELESSIDVIQSFKKPLWLILFVLILLLLK